MVQSGAASFPRTGARPGREAGRARRGGASGDAVDLAALGRAYGWPGELRRKRDTIHWGRSLPFLILLATPLLVPLVGWSWIALATAAGLYVVRMFAITGFYHRYFSHRTFRASRPVQFLMGVLGNSSGQKGPLWWAAHHRLHHRHAERAEDLHSPSRHGFLWSHFGWLLSDLSRPTRLSAVRDLARYPELRWLDRYYQVVPLVLATALYAAGAMLERSAPGLGTSGWQMVVWGFFVSTVVLFHATYTINSLAHRFGTRRFPTADDSRNNWLLALVTLGEGWHNNHHYCPSTVRQGFRWWEIDVTWYGLWMLARLGLIRDLRPIPATVRRAEREAAGRS